jgi:hypothetical protein
VHTELQSRPEIECPAEQKPGRGILDGIQLVQRASVAKAASIGSIRAKAGIAKLIAAQHPVNQESQRGPVGPLPGCQFGSEVSWNVASSASIASIAAFTATAWWMIGTSPA